MSLLLFSSYTVAFIYYIAGLVVGPDVFQIVSLFVAFIFCFSLALSVCFFYCHRKFDRDLESVSSGLKRLKRLSKAFDDIIGRDDR